MRIVLECQINLSQHITPLFKVSYGMQLWQDTTNACGQFPDKQSACALRTLEFTHWKFMLHFLLTTLIKRANYVLINQGVLITPQPRLDPPNPNDTMAKVACSRGRFICTECVRSTSVVEKNL